MRFHKDRLVLLLVAFACGCALHPTRLKNPYLDPTLDIFDVSGRALKPHAHPANASTFANSPIAASYNNIDPGRGVLLYDCAHFDCGQDFLSFRSTLTAAARLVNSSQPQADNLYQSLYASLCLLDAQILNTFLYKPLSTQTFQLLAVANRMDMASWDGTSWQGAEIHFIYGLQPAGDTVTDLTLILEFQISPVGKSGFEAPDFKGLAKSWITLPAISSSGYSAKLKAVLRASGVPLSPGDVVGAKSVRLRVNHNISGQQWRFSQLLLDPSSGTSFIAARLNDQIRCDISSTDFLTLWKAAQTALQSNPSHYSIPLPYLENATHKYPDLPDDGYGMPTPQGVCSAAVATRNTLAIQQCTGCHTVESRTVFTHIANRRSTASSVLSGFLVGTGGGPDQGIYSNANIHPSLVDLYNGNTSVAWPVQVSYETYVGGSCTDEITAPSPASNKFHDIARRTLFLAALVNDVSHLRRQHTPPLAQRFSSQSIE